MYKASEYWLSSENSYQKSLKLELRLPVQGQNIPYTAYLSEEYQFFQPKFWKSILKGLSLVWDLKDTGMTCWNDSVNNFISENILKG